MVLVRGGITVKPHVQKAADEVVEEFGPGLSPGTYNGHSPPEGPTQALDLFNQENQIGWNQQERIADYLIKHAKRLGVRYVIRWNPNGNDWIWNIERADEGWRAMATRDHRNHVHVTFYASVIWTEPSKPDKEIQDMAAKRWFRYAFNGQDYVVDIDKGTIDVTGHDDQLKVLDVLGCEPLGPRSQFVHDFWTGKFGNNG